MKKLLQLTDLKNHIKDGMTIMVGGFMVVGTPELLVKEVARLGVTDLTIICNDAGLPGRGVGILISNGQVKRLIASHIGLNPEAGTKMSEGSLQVDLVPQGTLAEQIRCGGNGLGGVLTPTGIGTMVEEGKQVIEVDGKRYLLETPLKADIALILGSTVDTYGNVLYTKTTRNFNPLMATAADKVIVQAREIIEEINPDHVMTPHIFVDYIVKEEHHG